MNTKQTSEFICVTDWEKVESGDFYLTDGWADIIGSDKDKFDKLRQQSKDGELYFAYIVRATDFCIYYQMDADQIIVDCDQNELVQCETAVIDTEKQEVWEYTD